MATKSLKKRESDLANVNRQLEILSNGIFQDGELPKFKDKIAETGQFPLRPNKLEVLQINLGYMFK
ncbi:MAG: radical SAM protein, partial [Bacteroidia bacterium]|nr:radical SAM protein [Bacteroidia bacterium]